MLKKNTEMLDRTLMKRTFKLLGKQKRTLHSCVLVRIIEKGKIFLSSITVKHSYFSWCKNFLF